MLSVLFLGAMVVCSSILTDSSDAPPLTSVTVTIIPEKATLFAGETLTFLATVVGSDSKAVNWSVEEEDGGAITSLGQYTAPKIQGIYHITATSRGRPEAMAVATITVLAYCDPLPAAFRP
ncbi:MAG: hypothetical protein LAP86_10620 [Acidobacteriia bacterium]|nr:hypothetical protein [Terriglobia bacterium]